MIRIECDNCEKPFEVDEAKAGTKVPCPECGDINRVPAAASAGAATQPDQTASDTSQDGGFRGTKSKADRAADAGLPPDSGPEVRVVKVRRCWFRSRPLKFSLAALILVGGIVGLIWGEAAEWPAWTKWLWILASLAASGVLGWWWVDRFGAALEITNKRTISHTGLFSRSTSEVVHDNIRNVQVDQSFWQRLWGTGKLGISSSGQDGVEISVNHLRKPDGLREMIDLYRPLD